MINERLGKKKLQHVCLLFVLLLHQIVPSTPHAIMVEKAEAPTLITLQDFENNLDGFLENNEKLAVLLDYDGTLAPIAPHPNDTAIPENTDYLLKRLANNSHIFLGVISGRSLSDVKNKVPIPGLTFGGNHGLEIENFDGTRLDYVLPEDIQNKYRKLVSDLKEHVVKNGAWVEDKKVSLTYHYRDTPQEFVEEQRLVAVQIIESYGFRANQAHRAIEAKPPVNWNKGEAALRILESNFGENWQTNTKVVFAGDDTTDEDAMKVLKGVGKSFRVSKNPSIQTYADYRLESTEQITILLQWIENHYHENLQNGLKS